MQTRLKYTAIIVFSMCLLGVVAIHIGHLPYTIDDVKSGTFFERMLEQKPSEIGDTLAGIFGSLAFVAAAIAVVMQSFELRAQREELQLTRVEFERMARALQAQTALIAKQGEIFEKEQEQRLQSAQKDVFDQMLIGVWDKMTTYPINKIAWVIPEQCYEDLDHHDSVSLFNVPETDYFDSIERTYSVIDAPIPPSL